MRNFPHIVFFQIVLPMQLQNSKSLSLHCSPWVWVGWGCCVRVTTADHRLTSSFTGLINLSRISFFSQLTITAYSETSTSSV